MKATRWLCFAVGGLPVMVAAAAFRRTLPAPTPLPDHVDVGGERYPVVDPGRLGGDATGGAPPQLLLVLAADGVRLAVPATEVTGTIEAEARDLAPLPWPYGGGEGWCAGVIVPAAPAARPVLALDLAGLVRAAASDGVTAAEVAG